MSYHVLIADDHPVVREGLVRIVESEGLFTPVGEASNGETALLLIEQQKPDIAVLDLSMPMMNGLEVVKTANERDYPVEFIILTMFSDEEFFDQAMDLGVKGYLLKESAVGELVACLKAVADGNYYVSPLVLNLHMKRTARLNDAYAANPALRDLTPAEKRVLALIAGHKTSKEIGKELKISYRTVQNHRTNICNKLNLQGYHKLLQFALDHKNSL